MPGRPKNKIPTVPFFRRVHPEDVDPLDRHLEYLKDRRENKDTNFNKE